MNLRLALLFFLAPVFLALIYAVYTQKSQQMKHRQLVEKEVLALYDGGQVTQDDLREYFQAPPTEDSPILRGLEMTAEDLVGLETEDPEWFEKPPGQLLLNRVIKHIALIEILNAKQNSKIQPQLKDDVTQYRESLMVETMEEELDDIKPKVTHEEMMAYYVEHNDEFHQDGQRFARHIMLDHQELEVSSASNQIPSVTPGFIQNKLHQGYDFQDLLRYSQSESVNQDGYLGWIEKGSLAKPFEEALWSMKIGEIKGPVKVNESIHFIQLADAQNEGLKPFRECVPEIRKILQKKKRTLHRLKLLGLPTDPLSTNDPKQNVAYRQALLEAAYAHGWHKHPKINEKVDRFRRYCKADLLFAHYSNEMKASEGYGAPHESSIFVESETLKRLLSQHDFQILIKLTFPQDSAHVKYSS